MVLDNVVCLNAKNKKLADSPKSPQHSTSYSQRLMRLSDQTPPQLL